MELSFETRSYIGSIALFFGLAFLTNEAADNNWIFVFSASVGAMGGLLHELAQSGGRVFFPLKDKKSDGIYLGSMSGIILGAISGVLLLKSFVNLKDLHTTPVGYYELGYETFVAGLGLKGISEALATKVPKEDPAPTKAKA